MLEFPFKWGLNPLGSFEDYKEFDLKSDDRSKWTIRCNISEFNENLARINSFEIRRQVTDKEYLISGEICITAPYLTAYKRKFSKKIGTGIYGVFIVCGIDIKVHKDNRDFVLEGLVKISNVTDSANGKSMERIQLNSQEQLLIDFAKLLDPSASRFADVALKCNGATIPAHKAVLAARSSVFEKMFASPMKESLRNEVDITDIDVSILRSLLVFVYTGKTPDLNPSSVRDLLLAAEKYQIQDLKTVCSCFLMDTMTVRDIFSFLVRSDMLDEHLKSYALDHICKNCVDFSVVEKTEEWSALRKEKPALAMDVLKSLIKSKEI